MLGMNPRSMRSSCKRSTLRTSAQAIASSMRRNRHTPSSSMPRGISVSGPHTPTSAPSFKSPQMFERATRETDLEARNPAVLVAEREEVEQRLGGMLVLAVARVDDVRADAAPQELR